MHSDAVMKHGWEHLRSSSKTSLVAASDLVRGATMAAAAVANHVMVNNSLASVSHQKHAALKKTHSAHDILTYRMAGCSSATELLRIPNASIAPLLLGGILIVASTVCGSSVALTNSIWDVSLLYCSVAVE